MFVLKYITTETKNPHKLSLFITLQRCNVQVYADISFFYRHLFRGLIPDMIAIRPHSGSRDLRNYRTSIIHSFDNSAES